MPIEIHEVEILNEPAPAAPSSSPPPRPAATASPAEHGDQLRNWHRELAARAARIRAD